LNERLNRGWRHLRVIAVSPERRGRLLNIYPFRKFLRRPRSDRGPRQQNPLGDSRIGDSEGFCALANGRDEFGRSSLKRAAQIIRHPAGAQGQQFWWESEDVRKDIDLCLGRLPFAGLDMAQIGFGDVKCLREFSL
jgi:hypothetical protein